MINQLRNVQILCQLTLFRTRQIWDLTQQWSWNTLLHRIDSFCIVG
ncbi:Uncharacterised protein [Serratia fonticola]|uniref:Uncharacterized protein n=1 Tax=Serratia fonticola TaxID=47917 RepID=A0A4U9UA89_SERFO|nr:Uncharacterised protein [Serratia fonticola]